MKKTERVKKFITAAKRCKLEATIKRKCSLEKRSLRRLYPNDTTFKNIITLYRKALKGSLKPDIAKLFLKHFNAGKIITRRINKVTNIRTELRRHNIVKLQKKDVLEAIRRALLMTENTKIDRFGHVVERGVVDMVLSLCLLTGRRPAEVFLGEFKYHSKNELKFSGQLKTKDSEQARSSYIIPVLCDARIIISTLNTIKGHGNRSAKRLEIKKASDVNSRLAHDMSRKVAVFFRFLDPKIKAKSLRKIYASICYDLFADKDLYDKSIYYALILGHSVGDSLTAESYKGYSVRGLELSDLYEDLNGIELTHLDELEDIKNDLKDMLSNIY